MQEDITIPAGKLATIPTQIVYTSVGDGEETFFVKPKKLDTRVMVMKTMIRSEVFKSALPVANLTHKQCVMNEGDLIGMTTPANKYCEITPPEPPPVALDLHADPSDHLQSLIDGFTPNMKTRQKTRIKQRLCYNLCESIF